MRKKSIKRVAPGSGPRGPKRKRGEGKTAAPGKKAPLRGKAVARGKPRAPTRAAGAAGVGAEERLQKILAAAGFGSRRQCEELITTGRVEVDRKTVVELGTKVDPRKQDVRVDGESLRRTKPVYVAVFKPKGVLCTNRDQQGRARAVDLVPPDLGRLFPVGRLDMHSEGLLLLTNDGTLADRLTHPRYGVQKVYRVLVAGTLDRPALDRLRRGIRFAEGFAKPDKVVLKSHHKQSTVLDITLSEGKNREIRRMLAALGHKVMQLIRISVGPIKLGELMPGEWRKLTPDEVRKLYAESEQVNK